MLDRDAYFRRWAELHGGYDPGASAMARSWLSVVYAVARRCGGVPPLAVTVAGLAAAIAVPLLAHPRTAGLLIAASLTAVLSGFLDSLDGAVAVVRGRDTRLGYVLDSVADRLADSAYVVALWLLGAPGWLCVVAGGAAALQEYVRARAGAAGMREIGVVTVFERPTRVILAAVTALASAAVTGSADFLATVAAIVWLVLAGIGLIQVLLAVRRLT
ncbi:MAG: CDP-alcohol phosphatidyltransferase family protein [Geodermatophilaceae bacterium]